VRSGVGQDNLSDFTTNLAKGFLCEYTQTFAKKRLDKDTCADFNVDRAVFNYATETWASKPYFLPRLSNDFVRLTPLGLLTRGERWINHADMIGQMSRAPDAVSDAGQREGSIASWLADLGRTRRRSKSERRRTRRSTSSPS
jgi:hypothetical protein